MTWDEGLLEGRGRHIRLKVWRPRGPFELGRGLIGRRELSPGEAMLLAPCRSVTMVFMSRPILAVYLDGGGRVLGHEVLRPWTLWSHAPKGARAVLETSPKLLSSLTEGMFFMLGASGRIVGDGMSM